MTGPPAHHAPVLRGVLAAIAAVDALSLFLFIGDAHARAVADGIPIGAFTGLLSHPVVRGTMAVLGTGAALAFARRPGRLGAGAVALAALALLSTTHAQLFGSPWRHLFFSGACLAGWLAGLAVTRRAGAPTDESYARMGGLALLGAAYLCSGISKLVYGGTAWLTGFPIQALIIGQDGLAAGSPVASLRIWVATTPAVAALCAIGTVGFELAGPALIAGRLPRLLVAAGLASMHATIFLLTPVLYWESMVLLVAFALSRDPAPASAEPARLPSLLTDRRAFARAAAVLAIVGVLGIAFQGFRAAAGTRGGSTARPPAPSPDTGQAG